MRSSARIRSSALLRAGYVKKREGQLALALSAMKLMEAQALLVKSRTLLAATKRR